MAKKILKVPNDPASLLQSGGEFSDDDKKKSVIYTTQVIDNLLSDMKKGYEVDMYPFFEGRTELRNSNINFKLSDIEREEFQKCYLDANYFVENYCKFLTDYGRSTVTLRDYQKEIISSVTTEKYNEELDLFVPENRYVIIMASRQIGKTSSGETTVKCKSKSKLKHKIIVWLEKILNKLIDDIKI